MEMLGKVPEYLLAIYDLKCRCISHLFGCMLNSINITDLSLFLSNYIYSPLVEGYVIYGCAMVKRVKQTWH